MTISTSGIDFDLYLPANKRCIKRVDLYNDIDADASEFKILGTKVSVARMDIGKGRDVETVSNLPAPSPPLFRRSN